MAINEFWSRAPPHVDREIRQQKRRHGTGNLFHLGSASGDRDLFATDLLRRSDWDSASRRDVRGQRRIRNVPIGDDENSAAWMADGYVDNDVVDMALGGGARNIGQQIPNRGPNHSAIFVFRGLFPERGNLAIDWRDVK